LIVEFVATDRPKILWLIRTDERPPQIDVLLVDSVGSSREIIFFTLASPEYGELCAIIGPRNKKYVHKLFHFFVERHNIRGAIRQVIISRRDLLNIEKDGNILTGDVNRLEVVEINRVKVLLLYDLGVILVGHLVDAQNQQPNHGG
jgi:hypothetical protein